MIPVAAIKPLLKYFDEIDRHCTAGLMNKRPHLETTITQIFCSLLDQEEQKQAALNYSFTDLRKDLSKLAGRLRIDIGTHEYNATVENQLTQSDLGLIINYINYYEPELSWTESWLFQAKSLKPSHVGPINYTAKSKIDNISIEQIERIKKLQRIVKTDFIRFMEYCPRASLLNKRVRDELIYYRNSNMSNNRFDYALGLELYHCLMTSSKNLEPGIFISYIEEDTRIKSYLDIYKNFWSQSYPFSWFILLRLSLSNDSEYHHQDLTGNNDTNNRLKIHPSNPIPEIDIFNINYAALAHAIVRCDKESVNYLLRYLDVDKRNFSFYPARSITIDVRTVEG